MVIETLYRKNIAAIFNKRLEFHLSCISGFTQKCYLHTNAMYLLYFIAMAGLQTSANFRVKINLHL